MIGDKINAVADWLKDVVNTIASQGHRDIQPALEAFHTANQVNPTWYYHRDKTAIDELNDAAKIVSEKIEAAIHEMDARAQSATVDSVWSERLEHLLTCSPLV